MSMWLSYWKKHFSHLSAKSSICILFKEYLKLCQYFGKLQIKCTQKMHQPIFNICLIYIFCEILVLSEQLHIFWNETNENNMLWIDLFALENWAYLIWIFYFFVHHLQLRKDQMEPKSPKLYLIFISKQLLTGFTQVMPEDDFSGLIPELWTT